MRQKTGPQTSAAEKTIKDIRRATRKHHSAEDKIRIVLEGLRGEDTIAAICRREGIAESLYYIWSKEFLEAGKKRLAGDTARSATSDEVKALRRESRDLKEALADLTLETPAQKKHDRGWGRRRMRYPATEKLEIIRIVEQSHLSARQTLDKLGIPRPTFYRWYDRFVTHGVEGLEDRTCAPSRVWNRIPDDVRDRRRRHTACAMISAGKRWRLYLADASSVMPIDYCLDQHQPVKATPPYYASILRLHTTPPYYAYTRAISRIRSFVSGLVVWCR